MGMYLPESLFSTLLGIHLGAELLVMGVIPSLTFLENNYSVFHGS